MGGGEPWVSAGGAARERRTGCSSCPTEKKEKTINEEKKAIKTRFRFHFVAIMAMVTGMAMITGMAVAMAMAVTMDHIWPYIGP